MYAQYQQYQNQNSQYQQQTTTSSSGNAQWNGTAWEYPNNNNNNNPQHPQQAQRAQQNIPPNPVETFTQYYHGWTKRKEELETYLRTLGNDNNSERQNAQSNRQWAEYYAQESSRAAHHFHQNPHSTSAPFELPPAPPAAGSLGNNNNRATNHRNVTSVSSSTHSHINHSSTATSSSSCNTSPSGSITRYVKRNIERPEVQEDPDLKAHIQSEIEKEIAAAIQKGTLQSKNWDLVPLISLPNTNVAKPPPPPPPPPPYSQQQQHQTNGGRTYQQQQTYGGGSHYQNNSSVYSTTNQNAAIGNYSNNNCGSYYGPGTSVSNIASKKDQGITSGSYYGPASSSHNNSRQLDKSSSQHNNKFFSPSSNYIGENKNSCKRPYPQEEEDFIPMGGIYGPSDGSSPTNNKKFKKNYRKHNKLVVMQNDHNGMDHSEQAMSKRANRFSGRGGIYEASAANSRSTLGVYGHDKYMGKGTIGGSKTILDETDFEQMTVKGTCATLEKDYLRLTAPPRAEFVRPFGILQQHLRNLQDEYYCCPSLEKADRNEILKDRINTPQASWGIPDSDKDEHGRFCKRQHDYLWFCSQLKAIRQDCTVQRIQGDLAVDVYETHARIALQEGDLNEYNQCQTQLKELYESRASNAGDDGTNSSTSGWKHEKEFIAYRLLYYVFLSTNEKYSGGSSDMFHIMLSLTLQDRKHPAIQHALKVREAVASSDYYWFFRLHKSCPNLGVFLTDLLVPTMRLRGLRRIAKAYRPSIELIVCLQFLGFGCKNDVDQSTSSGANGDEATTGGTMNDSGAVDDEGKSWLLSCGGVVEGSKLITKDSDIHVPNTDTKKNSLI